MNNSRRTFLKNTSLAAGGILSAPYLMAKSGRMMPSDTVRVGLIGARSMGFGDFTNCLRQEGVACAGICDVDQEVLDRRSKDIEEEFGVKPKQYRDFRDMLNDKDVDAVVIGTPDHWHCLMTVMAVEAGKAVYVEKPLANSVAECEAMVKAVRDHKAIVQVGQQQRSGKHWQEVVATVQSGDLGQIRRVEAWGNFGYGKGNPAQPNETAPETLNYDMWLGPAPERPYNPGRLHGAWRHIWDYGGGLLTDWGVHLLDVVLWAMKDTVPKMVLASGGIYQYPDNLIETPDTLDVLYDMGNWNLHWSHVGGNEVPKYGRNYGIAFLGSEGVLVVNREGWEVRAPKGGDNPEFLKAFAPGVSSNHLAHAGNFIESIRANTDPICPIEKGRDAANLAQYGIISHRSGRAIAPAQGIQALMDQPELRPFVQPTYRGPWTFPTW